ncbi:hypothetical protein E1258_10520 [Micromonospora sp. KC207]|nr:hypothetical protein E1258_10520 [Micromonospora sp. KC207]
MTIAGYRTTAEGGAIGCRAASRLATGYRGPGARRAGDTASRPRERPGAVSRTPPDSHAPTAQPCQPRASSQWPRRSAAVIIGHHDPAADQAIRADHDSRERSSKLTVRVRFPSPAPGTPAQVNGIFAAPGPFSC